jgi:hypothetical protein
MAGRWLEQPSSYNKGCPNQSIFLLFLSFIGGLLIRDVCFKE